MAAAITPKVASAGITGTVAGTPLSIFVIWLIELIPAHDYPYHVVVPAIVAGAIASVVASGAAVVGGYFARHSQPTTEQVAEILHTNEMQNQRRNI